MDNKNELKTLLASCNKDLTEQGIDILISGIDTIYKSSKKIDLIVQLIEESIDRFSDKHNDTAYFEIRPVFDGFNLLLEKNTVIRVRNTEGESVSTYKIACDKILENCFDKNKFSSLEIGNRYILDIAIIEENDYRKLNDEECSLIVDLIDKFKNNNLLGKIEHAIGYESSKKTNIIYNHFSFEDYNVSNDEKKEFKENIILSLRTLISDSFRQIENNESLLIKDIGCPNVFTVIRYASNSRKQTFKYTAQILLSKNQSFSITDFFKQKRKIETEEELRNYFEAPLIGDSTSQADNCFQLETVRFDIFSTDVSKSDSDIKRTDFEGDLYNVINPNYKKKLFYVPVHLNGAPWIAFYRIQPKEKDIDYINFYRSKISHISNQIRTAAFDVFFNLYREKLRKEIFNVRLSLEEAINIINQYGKALSCFFPFYIPILPIPDTDNKEYYLHTLEKSEFRYWINKIWENEIDYENLTQEEFSKKLKRNFSRIKTEFAAIENNRRTITAAYGISHFYGNMLNKYKSLENEIIMDFRSQYGFDFNESLEKRLQLKEEEFNNIIELSNLFTIISKQNTDRVEGPFFSTIEKADQNYLADTEYNVLQYIESNFSRLTAGNKKLKLNAVSKIIIDKFIEGDRRPFNILYDNLFIELINNFNKSASNCLEIGIEESNSNLHAGKKNTDILYFKNVINKEKYKVYPKEYHEILSNKFWGAIYYLHILIKKTEIGFISLCYEEKNGTEIFYKLGIELEGLKYE